MSFPVIAVIYFATRPKSAVFKTFHSSLCAQQMEHPVEVVISGFDIVFAVGPAVDHILQFGAMPGPHGGGVGFQVDGDGQLDRRQRLSIFPGAGFSAQSVIDGVLHPVRFVEILHEEDISVLIGEVPRFSLGQLESGEFAPVTGRRGQVRQGTDIQLPPADIGDGVVRTVFVSES